MKAKTVLREIYDRMLYHLMGEEKRRQLEGWHDSFEGDLRRLEGGYSVFRFCGVTTFLNMIFIHDSSRTFVSPQEYGYALEVLSRVAEVVPKNERWLNTSDINTLEQRARVYFRRDLK